jgi:uncharacterized SAM-binding protein YcdF (DUF218 family)
MDAETLGHARAIWKYLHLGHQPIPADLIVSLGTNDLRVADFAADLYQRGYGKNILFTGGIAHVGDLLATGWDRSEAEVFAERAVTRGVAAERILLETQATNTSANIRLGRKVVEASGSNPRNIVLAVKPFMQRRTMACMAVEWPEMPATVASPEMTMDEYFTDELTPERVIHIMMGDLQRIWVYARKQWQAPQRVTPEVLAAYEALRERGFTRQLIPEE